MQITEIYVTTMGLYAWGKGFLSRKQAVGWATFWRKHTGNFWNACRNSDGSVFLSTIYGGGMIHPMDFKLILRQDEVKSRSELAELDAILHGLAQTLGFTYRIKVRGHVVPDNQTDWRLFSTENGVEESLPGRVGVPESSEEVDGPVELTVGVDSASGITCGKPPYTVEIVRTRDGEPIWTASVRYRSERAAESAVLQQATLLKHRCGRYTRHWITKHNEHIIDYGSHVFYGRITSNRKDK